MTDKDYVVGRRRRKFFQSLFKRKSKPITEINKEVKILDSSGHVIKIINDKK